jgi:uroporphyrinogen-III synthase
MAAEAPKRGARALVTRPRAEAEDLVAALLARGVAPLIEPLLEIVAVPAPTLDFAGVQAVLCTSGNGVRALARASSTRHLPLFAVGDASAAYARSEGFARVESAGGAAADLARLVAARLRPEGGRLLHAAGAAATGDLAGALAASGFAVDRVVLYEARAAARLGLQTVRALRRGAIDLALFFSPRTAAVFATLAAEAGVAACCAGVAALAISPAAAAPLAALPWRERRIARHPDRPSLLAALDALLAESDPCRQAG